MKYHKQPSELAYKQGIQNFIEKIKEKNIDFEVFSFGSTSILSLTYLI